MFHPNNTDGGQSNSAWLHLHLTTEFGVSVFRSCVRNASGLVYKRNDKKAGVDPLIYLCAEFRWGSFPSTCSDVVLLQASAVDVGWRFLKTWIWQTCIKAHLCVCIRHNVNALWLKSGRDMSAVVGFINDGKYASRGSMLSKNLDKEAMQFSQNNDLKTRHRKGGRWALLHRFNLQEL